jgi:excisionase family DNA binding protein
VNKAPTKRQTIEEGRWLSVTGAAVYAGLSSQSIRPLINAQKLTAHRPVRGRILIDRREFDALIESSRGAQ